MLSYEKQITELDRNRKLMILYEQTDSLLSDNKVLNYKSKK